MLLGRQCQPYGLYPNRRAVHLAKACVWKPCGREGQWKAIKTLRAGSTDGFRALAWSPDCSRLVAAGMEHDAWVYHVSGGEQRQWEANGVLRGHTDVLRAVAWSPCGRKVLTGGDDKSARIWKASRQSACWEQVVVLRGNHSESVRAVAWRPDCEVRQQRVVIAVGLKDSTIVLWQSSTPPHDRRCFEVFATLSGHTDAVRRERRCSGATAGLWTGRLMVLFWPVAVGSLKVWVSSLRHRRDGPHLAQPEMARSGEA